MEDYLDELLTERELYKEIYSEAEAYESDAEEM